MTEGPSPFWAQSAQQAANGPALLQLLLSHATILLTMPLQAAVTGALSEHLQHQCEQQGSSTKLRVSRHRLMSTDIC